MSTMYHVFQNRYRIVVAFPVTVCKNELIPFLYRSVPEMHALTIKALFLTEEEARLDSIIYNRVNDNNQLGPATGQLDDAGRAMCAALQAKAAKTLAAARLMEFKVRQIQGSHAFDAMLARCEAALETAISDPTLLTDVQQRIVAALKRRYDNDDVDMILQQLRLNRSLDATRLDVDVANYLETLP